VGRQTILIVEDEVLVGEEIREELLALGYEVPSPVRSGEAVLPAVEVHHPSLILMDINIEGSIDGVDAAALVRATSDIPIIYLTAFSDEHTLSRAAATGPSAYLIKPFSSRELAANVSMALSASAPRPSSQASLDSAYAPFLDAMDAYALFLDPEGRIEYANRGALNFLGFPDMDSAMGRKLSELLEMPPSSEVRSASLRLRRETETLVHLRSEPLVMRNGRETGALVVLDTMSQEERHHLETSASASNKALQAILPGPGTLGAGWNLDGFLLPSPSGSGDLYGAFPLDDERFAFYAVDVMGHGSYPSLLAFSLNEVVRFFSFGSSDEPIPPPCRVMDLLNRKYSSGYDIFLSMAYGHMNRRTGAFSLVLAGHPPPVLARAVGVGRHSWETGPALGAFDNVSYQENQEVLGPKDRLIMYSDGLLAHCEAAKGGADSCERVCAQGMAMDLSSFIAQVRDSTVDTWNQGRGVDDVSLFVIERS